MSNEKGSVVILLLLSMTLLLGMIALVVDFGNIYLEKQKLSDAVDAAALAGAQDLVANPDLAGHIAEQYAISNGVTNPSILVDLANKEITVKGKKKVPFFFAKAFGFKEKLITSTSIAKVRPISSGSGFVPLGVVQQHFDYGKIYDLKLGPGDSYNGNFGALALGSSGASSYEYNLANGYKSELKIGMTVPTEPGNMSGPTEKGLRDRLDLDAAEYSCSTFSNASRECNRVMFIPVIDSLNLDGRDGVKVVGFAAFYLEAVHGTGVDSVIEGRFMRTVFPGDWDESNVSNNFGLYAVKLSY